MSFLLHSHLFFVYLVETEHKFPPSMRVTILWLPVYEAEAVWKERHGGRGPWSLHYGAMAHAVCQLLMILFIFHWYLSWTS